MTNYNVPTLDLSYYLFSSVKTPVRQAHMTNLLNQYLETLKKISKDLGHPFDMSFEVLLARRKFIGARVNPLQQHSRSIFSFRHL